MRIAILEASASTKSATGVRGSAMAAFLRASGHEVEVVAPTADERAQVDKARFGLTARVRRLLGTGGKVAHPWILLADVMEPRVRAARFDAVIARAQDVGVLVTRRVAPRCLYDMANIGFLEQYHTWGPNLDEVEETWRLERDMLDAADAILSPHDLLTDYFLSHFPGAPTLATKTTTVRLGAEPAARTAAHAEPPRLAYAGSYYYIQDPWLLAELTRLSPFAIDCYGFTDPNRAFLPARLNYKGLAPTTDFLADYQFGLITVSRDRLRQFSPATKFPYYFAHGLPVLFPDWMREGYEYPDAAVPYSEDTFVERVREAAAPDRWAALHAAAVTRARDLTWDRVLQPLAALLDPRG